MRRALGGSAAAAATLVAALAGAGCAGGGAAQHAPSASGQVAEGRGLFPSAGCGSCHTLRAAGSHGTNGPDFDTSERLTQAQIRRALTSGVNGMPSYAGRLTPRQLDAVAAYVYSATH